MPKMGSICEQGCTATQLGWNNYQPLGKPVNLRTLPLAILIGLHLTPVIASASTNANSSPKAGSNVLAASSEASMYLRSNDLSTRLKAIDSLSACDAAMHPICTVDMGMAYGRLSHEDQLDSKTRTSYANNAKRRLGPAAALGNMEARAMLETLNSPSAETTDFTTARAERQEYALLQEAEPSSSPSVAVEALISVTEDSTERSSMLGSHPMQCPELQHAQQELQLLHAQLNEARSTIASLQSQLIANQVRQFDAASANREALQNALKGDYETAIPLFRKAAEANHPGAINNLAMMFVNGTGVPRDLQQALTLFERAAEMGNVESAENAARIYAYGIGRPRDPSRARHWYGRASQMGSVKAQRELLEMEQALASHRR